MIRKLKSGEYRLYSRQKNTKTAKRRNLGTFSSRAAAEKHERAVQFFKKRCASIRERRTTNNERRVCYPSANSFALCAAFTTALINVTRSLPSSNSMIASIVQPAGVVTASFNKAG